MDKHLLRAALVFSLMPNVSFSLTRLDTQPFAALLGLGCVLAWGPVRLPAMLWALLAPAGAALVLGLASGSAADMARSFITYLSPWIFAATGYLAWRRGLRIHRYVLAMLCVWAVVGTLQWLVSPLLFDVLVNTRTTESRGVTGLAPEPSFYGLSVLMMWLLLLQQRPALALRPAVVLLGLYQVVLLSRSSLAILLTVLIALPFALRSVRALAVVAAALLAVPLFADVSEDSGSRALVLLSQLINNPALLLYLDASVSERFYHVFLSLKEALASGLVPHGITAFADVIVRGQVQYDSYWWGEPGNKIMSGVGGALFELGWFALAYPLAYVHFLRRDRGVSRFHAVVAGMGLLLVLLNTVTPAAPHLGWMMGIMAARAAHAGGRRWAAAGRPRRALPQP